MDIKIEKECPSPIYIQILDQIKNAILKGDIPSSKKLPSERELAARLSISRMTVRRAFERLTDGGFIVSRSGKGAFASRPRLDQPVGKLMRFFSDMKERGLLPESRLLSVKKVKPPKEVSDFLLETRKSHILRIERVLTADGMPYVHELKYLNYKRCIQLRERDYAISGNDFKFMDECVRCWMNADLSIDIELLTDTSMKSLGFNNCKSVFLVKNKVKTFEDAPLSFIFSRYRSDLYTFRLKLTNYPHA